MLGLKIATLAFATLAAASTKKKTTSHKSSTSTPLPTSTSPSAASGPTTAPAGPAFQCFAGDELSWCVHTPASYVKGAKTWPTIVYLPGQGSRGDLSNAATLASYDGPGALIASYAAGDRSTVSTLASESFITVVMIAPTTELHFFPDKVQSVLSSAKSAYSIDSSRISLVGYSMGARGTWRQLVTNPSTWAAGAPSAGYAEAAGSQYIEQEPAPATFGLLKNAVGIPVRAFAGSADTTNPATLAEKTQNQLVRLGDKKSSLTVYPGATHETMGTLPFDAGLFQWLLSQTNSRSSRRQLDLTASSPQEE